MTTFRIQKNFPPKTDDPVRFYDRKEVGFISIDASRNVYVDDKSEQKELRSNADLQALVGENLYEDLDTFVFERYQHRPDYFYKWINSSGINFLKQNNIQIATSRGTLRDICIVPFNLFSQLQLYVRKKDGILYINTLPEKRQESDEIAKLGEYKGTKFVYMSTYDNGNPYKMNNINHYQAVCKITLGNSKKSFQILFSGEVDAVVAPHGGYAQTKTHNLKKNHTKFKALSWWIQSHIMGVEKVVVGAYKESSGVIQSVNTYSTASCEDFQQQLLSRSWKKRSELDPKWQPDNCFLFCSNVLQFILDNVPAEEDGHLYKVKHEENHLKLERMQIEEEAQLPQVIFPLPTRMQEITKCAEELGVLNL